MDVRHACTYQNVGKVFPSHVVFGYLPFNLLDTPAQYVLDFEPKK